MVNCDGIPSVLFLLRRRKQESEYGGRTEGEKEVQIDRSLQGEKLLRTEMNIGNTEVMGGKKLYRRKEGNKDV